MYNNVRVAQQEEAIPVFMIIGLFQLYEYCHKHKKEIRIFLKIDKIKVNIYNIVKTEKERFLIKYQPSGSVETKIVNKTFKTRPKAEAWVEKNFTCHS